MLKTFFTIQIVFIINIYHLKAIINPQTVNSFQKLSSKVVQCIAFGKNPEIIYYSQQRLSNNLYYIYKYNVTSLITNSSTLPLLTIMSASQAYSPDRLLQINQSHIITYSTQYTMFEVYQLSGGIYLFKSQPAVRIKQFIYQQSRQEIYMLYIDGTIQILTFNDFIYQTAGGLYTLDLLGQQIHGQISPDGNYLAVGTLTLGYIQIYDLVNRTSYMTLNFPPGMCTFDFTWNSDSQSIFLFHPISGILLLQTLSLSPYSKFLITIPQAYDSVLSIKYLNQTNQIFLMVFYPETKKIFDLLTYNFSAITSIRSQTYQTNITGFNVVKRNNLMKIKFSLWFGSTNKTFKIGSVPYINYVAPPPISNSTNITVSSNTTNATNFTVTNNTNNTINQNITILTNNTSNNLTNQTHTKQYDQDYYMSVKAYNSLIQYTIQNNAVSSLNKIPGSRHILKPLFIFFSNFDDLWLYIYDQKQYNEISNKMFQTIIDLEQAKWQIINYQYIWKDMFGFNTYKLQNYLNSTTKSIFTSYKFFNIEQKSNGYLLNTLNFYLQNLIFLLIFFIVGASVFSLMNYLKIKKIKQIFIRFSFKLYLLILILEGNIQIMSYYFGFQLKYLIHGKTQEKLMNIFIVMLHFFFFISIMFTYFFIKQFYHQKAKYFADIFLNINYGFVYLTLQWGLRNFILGLIHMILSESYIIKIQILIIIQLLFLGVNIKFVSFNKINGKKYLIRKSRVWINIFTCLNRILLISTFLISQNLIEQFSFINKINILILATYILFWLLSIINQLFMMQQEVKQMISYKSQEKTFDLKVNQQCFDIKQIAQQSHFRYNMSQNKQKKMKKSNLYLVSQTNALNSNKGQRFQINTNVNLQKEVYYAKAFKKIKTLKIFNKSGKNKSKFKLKQKTILRILQ